jgi:DegV family protein with EDD domain
LNIKVVAYYIHRGQEVLRDLVSIQRAEFLEWLATTKTLPTTACPGVGDYFETYKSMILQGAKEIVSIHMTSKGSGAYQAATVAQTMVKEEFPDVRVEVVDTQNVSLCQGWMTIEAARCALEGADLDQVLQRVKAMIPVTRMIQTADTLKYLHMGGRIGLAQRIMGTMLNIKPLIGMQDGEIVPLGTARSRHQAYDAMVRIVEETVGSNKIKVAFVHAGALQEIEKLINIVEARLNIAESLIAELSPALAVHTGPGTAGLCYFPVE